MLTFDTLPLLAKTAGAGAEAVKAHGTSPVVLLTIFVMAIYLGVELISKIPPTLHTPLMSGSNAISGITLIGAIFAAGEPKQLFFRILGSVAVAFAMINVVGGFLVTHRMLGMFIKKKK